MLHPTQPVYVTQLYLFLGLLVAELQAAVWAVAVEVQAAGLEAVVAEVQAAGLGAMEQ